jgi:hypothetical protein
LVVQIPEGLYNRTPPQTPHSPTNSSEEPFEEGTISFSWKVEKEQRVVLVVDGKKNGKATHNLKVYFNGRPGNKSKTGQLTIMTYDGSTRKEKKATFNNSEYHAAPGQWHKTAVTIEGNKVAVVINDKSFTATSEKLRDAVRRFAIGNHTGSLHTKDLKLIKRK